MNEIPPADLLELVLLSESSIDYQFQFWLTITFATVVASFAARDLLSRSMRILVATLYLLATFVLASRWYYDSRDIEVYVEALLEYGIESPLPVAAAISRIILMLIGSATTIYFIISGSRGTPQ
jgi:hypothetical protein